MFCPKCGTQNPDNGKFCRSCGTDLGNVSNVLTGNSPNHLPNRQFTHFNQQMAEINSWKKKKPISWEGAITKLFSGLAFLVVAIALAVTGVAGGKVWWFWMLIPGFGSLGSGIAQIIQLKKMEKGTFIAQTDNSQNLFSQNNQPLLSAAEFDHLENLISGGSKIEAIKNYRDITGANLKQAKKAIENIEQGKIQRPVPTAPIEDYSAPPPRGSIYDTGELNNPPSVTEGTTRHLEINKEGETMTLPQKK